MALQGNVDEAGEFCIRGWACDDAFPERQAEVEFRINGEAIAIERAGMFRADLLDARIGDGRKAFCFNPQDYWTHDRNDLQVTIAGTGAILSGGIRTISACPAHTTQARDEARRRATRERLDGADFLDQVDELFSWTPETSILEFDPVHGELLQAMAECGKPLARYLGVDLARDRTEALHTRFSRAGARFRTGDADVYPYPQAFQLVLAAATLDRRYPSCAPMLRHIVTSLQAGGMLFADFGGEDETMSASRAFFHPDGAFTRIYSQAELCKMVSAAGLTVTGITRLAGSGRMLIAASK